MKQVRRITIIGGAATGEESLENIADTACNLGIAGDAEVFTLPRAIKNPDKVRRATRSGATLTHSVGILAIDNNVIVPDLLACNGPEQWIGRPKMGRISLGVSAWRKMRTNREFADDPNHEFAAEYRHIGNDNRREVRRHPFVHARLVGAVRVFSTSAYLRERMEAGADNGIETAAAVTVGDEFWPHLDGRDYGDVRVIVHEGNHDALLANPGPILVEWAKQPTE